MPAVTVRKVCDLSRPLRLVLPMHHHLVLLIARAEELSTTEHCHCL